MKNGMKSQLAMLAMSMDMMPQNTNFRDTRSEDIPSSPKQPIIPNGCKKYCFDKYGWYGIEKMKCSHIVFECIAANEKSAIRKFNNWKSKSN